MSPADQSDTLKLQNAGAETLLVEPIEVSARGSSFLLNRLSSTTTEEVKTLIQTHIGSYEDVGAVVASTMRRMKQLLTLYGSEKCFMLVATCKETGQVAGAAGLGPLADLPVSEGYGEIRDLVVHEDFRNKGLGRTILETMTQISKDMGYKYAYLQTTPQMKHAKALFEKLGYRAVRKMDKNDDSTQEHSFPYYYILELEEKREIEDSSSALKELLKD